MADILVLHPDTMENRRLRNLLRSAGYRCKGVYHTEKAADWFDHSNQRALLITPSSMLAPVRAHMFSVPVLILSDDGKNSCTGLEAYLPSDCEDAMILLTVAQLLTNSACMRTFGSLTLNIVTGEVFLHGKPMQLTTTESALLEALMESPEEALTREELLVKAWGYSCGGVTRTVDVHVQRLRKKLGKESIETVYRTGYRLCMA